MPVDETVIEEAQKVEDSTEVLEPSVAERVQVIGVGDYQFTLVQKPLSFMGKLDFFSVMGRALDRAMSGPDGVSVADLMDVPERSDGGYGLEDIRDADTFIRGIAKLLSYAPEIVGDLYCVFLSVPRGQRETIKRIMELPEEEGGLNDEDGFAILDTFVDQNWEVLVDFFGQRIQPFAKKVGAKLPKQPETESQPSQ